MRVCVKQLDEYFEFASRALGEKYRHEDGARVIASLSNDARILAVAVFTNFTDTNCELSIASDGSRRWIGKGFARAVSEYVFVQCGLRRATAIVAEDNAASLQLCDGLGFQREGVLRDWFIAKDGTVKDGIVLGMLRKECRWLPTMS